MAHTEHPDFDELHPIDIVEQLAEHHQWEFDRIRDDQIAMAVGGQWRTYSITLAWSSYDETLRLICTYELGPTEQRMPALFELLNLINDRCWAGAFTWWEEQQLMVFRYGLLLTGQESVGADQVDTMIGAAVTACEQYYPAVQLTLWGDCPPDRAIATAIGGTYGRA